MSQFYFDVKGSIDGLTDGKIWVEGVDDITLCVLWL